MLFIPYMKVNMSREMEHVVTRHAFLPTVFIFLVSHEYRADKPQFHPAARIHDQIPGPVRFRES